MHRLLSDRVIGSIVAKGGVVGVLPLNWALSSSWRASDGKGAVTLPAVTDAIDAVCQIAGDASTSGSVPTSTADKALRWRQRS
jgi:microsomal dipeptidase-like Zn-dependent dipeptidase